MIRYLSLAEVLTLHGLIIDQTGGSDGLRGLGMLEAALGQPRQTFGGDDLYPDLPSKAATLGFSLINNHPFIDGNKRVGHAAMEAFLMLNGSEIEASVETPRPRSWRSPPASGIEKSFKVGSSLTWCPFDRG